MTPILELAVVAMPFFLVGALLRLVGRIQRRRARCIARQIALTDAIHRELGAAAAPVVMRDWSGTWTVRMAVPLRRKALVSALTRITRDFFSSADQTATPRLRILLTEPEPAARRRLPALDSPELSPAASSPLGKRAA